MASWILILRIKSAAQGLSVFMGFWSSFAHIRFLFDSTDVSFWQRRPRFYELEAWVNWEGASGHGVQGVGLARAKVKRFTRFTLNNNRAYFTFTREGVGNFRLVLVRGFVKHLLAQSFASSFHRINLVIGAA